MLPFDKAAFGAKLYALRKNAKLSQEKAAEQLGVRERPGPPWISC